MKRIVVTLTLDCRDDVTPSVLAWMRDNLEEHAEREFGKDYDPEWTDGYQGPPLVGLADATGAVLLDEKRSA